MHRGHYALAFTVVAAAGWLLGVPGDRAWFFWWGCLVSVVVIGGRNEEGGQDG